MRKCPVCKKVLWGSRLKKYCDKLCQSRADTSVSLPRFYGEQLRRYAQKEKVSLEKLVILIVDDWLAEKDNDT